jgi:hypothetical protein
MKWQLLEIDLEVLNTQLELALIILGAELALTSSDILED